MQYAGPTYSLSYDPLDQQINFDGTMRLVSDDEAAAVLGFLTAVHERVRGTLRLSFRRLRYINAEGMRTISSFVTFARSRDALSLKIVASSILAWSVRSLPNLCALWDRVEFSAYDQGFYESQEIIEDQAFIPLLRNQTRIVWPLERASLAAHGLARGARVAEICCGAGDVPLLICREFAPSFVLGVDHSEAAVAYARRLQGEFAVRNAEFQRGDATALLLPDDSFDFVSCRLSLQIFSQPELILRELIRIARPGGRIYVTGEDYDLIVGYEVAHNPEARSVSFKGTIRLQTTDDYQPIVELLQRAHVAAAGGALSLDFRQLQFLNSSGISTVSKFVIAARKQDSVRLSVLGSSEIYWQQKSLGNLQKLWPKVQIEIA